MKATYNGPSDVRIFEKKDLPEGALEKKTQFPKGVPVEVPAGFKDAIKELNKKRPENWSFDDGNSGDDDVTLESASGRHAASTT